MLLFQRDFSKILFETADIEQFSNYIQKEKPVEFALQWYYNKPLKDCTLQEVMDAVVLNIKIQGTYDSLSFKEDENGYNINLTHSLVLMLLRC